MNVKAPFFALVHCGYLASRYRLLPENAVPALNTFVLYFALPCMLFRFASSAAFREIVNIPGFLAHVLPRLTGFGFFAGLTGFVARESVQDSSFGALEALGSNQGTMGTPLMPALQGVDLTRLK